MDIFKLSENIMSMDDNTWAKHANPISVITRFTCLPLIVLALWSRVWLGWWYLLPLALALFWTWLNPRITSGPGAKTSWSYQGVMGERFFLNRRTLEIPPHHSKMAYILTIVMMVGMLLLVYGLVTLNFWATLCGLLVAVGGKCWFVDRMVWLYNDMNVDSC